ncbi:cytochrome-c peroxidase [Aliikangiella sp. IMCC44359]|uniref:cytochrome-c peroxidase n=1 Tax=Aliikangiella sp. IMCC44359 TaxID=3459125 RepID=UPI00403B2591
MLLLKSIKNKLNTKRRKTYLVSIIFISLLSNCSEEPQKTPSKAVKIDPSIYQFTTVDINFLKNFSLSQLAPPPKSLSNQFADNIQAAQFGKTLFFDVNLSRDKKVACASCHKPELYFTDGLSRSKAVGTTRRSSPTILGAAYSPWQFWDGRKDSLWSQALGPIENPNEFSTTRVEYVRFLLKKYASKYQEIFGNVDITTLDKLPLQASPVGDKEAISQWQQMDKTLQNWVNQVFTNAGKAIMAYERQLKIPHSRFDQFIDALVDGKQTALANILTPAEVKGMRLFVGKANCASCHNGALFTNFEFHNIGAPDLPDIPVELGRYAGVQALVADEFTCLSEWSDANKQDCVEMRFLKTQGLELVGAIKTPTLRNIGATAPYMQTGQFAQLPAVINHYNVPTPPVYNRQEHPSRPHFDILPLKLTPQETLELESFLNTLTSPLPMDDPWWGLKR